MKKLDTMAQRAKDLGISKQALSYRLKAGWPPDLAYSTPARGAFPLGKGRRNALLLTHQGETLSLVQWAERTGILRMTIYHRYRRGLPMHRVLSGASLSKKTELKTECEARGLCYSTVWRRIRRGMSPTEALAWPRFRHFKKGE
jgi:hypothetical protein